MNNSTIIPMTTDHFTAVAAIENDVFPDPWTPAGFLEAISFSDQCWVAVMDRQIAGYLITQWIVDEIHILNIAVARDHHRHGIGNSLLSFLVKQALHSGMADIFLEVRVSNTAAQSLYRKFGFHELSTRKRYYRDGEDALIMHLNLTDESEQNHETHSADTDSEIAG